MFHHPPTPNYAIGYGNRSIDRLIAVLRKYEISFLHCKDLAPTESF